MVFSEYITQEWDLLNHMVDPSKLTIEIPYDPEIPLLGIYLEKTIIQKDICTQQFIAALFTIVRI